MWWIQGLIWSVIIPIVARVLADEGEVHLQ